MRNSVSVTVISNGFCCSRQSNSSGGSARGFYFQRFRLSLRANSALYTSKCYATLHNYSMVSVCLSTISRKRLISGSKMVENSLLVPSKVGTIESSLFCEMEEEEEMNQRDRDELEASILGQKLPPWKNLTIDKELECESAAISQPELVSERKVVLDTSKVHLLEEKDEEMLSKRLLVLSRTNKVRSAMELFRSMELSGLHPNVHACNSFLCCLLRNKLLDDGWRIFEFIETKRITTGHTYSLILKAIANAQGCHAALKMFAQMEEKCEVKKGFDAIVYNTMISISGKENNWPETQRLWRCMMENGLTGTQVTYSLLVSIFVRCGQNELALDAYGEMVQNKLEPNSDVMLAIIGACSKEEKWDFALSIFQTMMNQGLEPNAIACNALINLLGKAGKDKLAFKVFNVMKSLGHSPDSYTWNALLGALDRVNRHEDALQLFECIRKCQGSELNLHLYNNALMSCSKLGFWKRAVQLLWHMEACGMTVSTASYNLVIGACETAGKPDVALQVYEHMRHQKCPADTFTHLALIRVCIWGSFWEDVEEILNVSFSFAQMLWKHYGTVFDKLAKMECT